MSSMIYMEFWVIVYSGSEPCHVCIWSNALRILLNVNRWVKEIWNIELLTDDRN